MILYGLNFCECFCSGEARKNKRFISGHNKPNLGRKYSEEYKKQLSDAHSGQEPWNKGKTGVYKEETLEKMSEAKKDKYIGENHPMFGKHHTEEAKKKQSVAKLNYEPWNKGTIGLMPPAWNINMKMSEEFCQKVSEGHKGKQMGENNPNWKDGITSEYSKIRKSEEYKQWMKEIYKRDGYLCYRCNTGGKLTAHHIINFAKLVHENQCLWDMNNGITLCIDCHKQFHKKFGNKNNSQHQIYEFIYENH